jgi:hypothetical protein
MQGHGGCVESLNKARSKEFSLPENLGPQCDIAIVK